MEIKFSTKKWVNLGTACIQSRHANHRATMPGLENKVWGGGNADTGYRKMLWKNDCMSLDILDNTYLCKYRCTIKTENNRGADQTAQM